MFLFLYFILRGLFMEASVFMCFFIYEVGVFLVKVLLKDILGVIDFFLSCITLKQATILINVI